MPSAYDLLTAGLSTRQVDYWTRLGYLRPELAPGVRVLVDEVPAGG